MDDRLSPQQRRAVRELGQIPVGQRGIQRLAKLASELQVAPAELAGWLRDPKFYRSVDAERERLAAEAAEAEAAAGK
jgi:hypothetical protein